MTPLYLIHFLTHRCNLGCAFCCDGERRHGETASAELTTSEVEAFYDRSDAVQLSITGGEPTLREDLTGLLVRALGGRFGAVSLNSNGLLSDRLVSAVEEALATSRRSRLKVNISLDGFRNTHDDLRGRSGAFEQAMESLVRLSALRSRYSGLHLRVNTVVCQENLDELPSLARHLQVAVPSVDGQVFSLRRGPRGAGISRELVREYKSVTDDKRRAPGGLLGVLHRRMVHQVSRAAQGDRMRFRCPAGRRLAEVDATGRVLACEVLPGDEAYLGHLRDHDWNVGGVLSSARSRQVHSRIVQGGCRCTFECAHLAAAALDPLGTLWSSVVRPHRKQA